MVKAKKGSSIVATRKGSSVVAVDSKTEELGLRLRNAARGTLNRRVTEHGTVAHSIEHGLKRSGAWIMLELRRHAFISVTAAGAAGVAVATAIGVGELAVGAALAYAGYNIWVRGETPEEAFCELAEGLEGHAGH